MRYYCHMLITKTSRDIYQFDTDFFQPDGNVSLPDFISARKFATQMSAQRAQPVPASDIYAMQLIDEAMRLLVRDYAPPEVMSTAASHVNASLGPESVATTQKKFVSEFPPEEVYRGEAKVEEYLKKLTNGRIKTIEELIYIFTHNSNPAVTPLLELVDDEPLEPTAYRNLISALDAFFVQNVKDHPQSPYRSESLFEILRGPA